jgi:hypothetical protein
MEERDFKPSRKWIAELFIRIQWQDYFILLSVLFDPPKQRG